MPEEGSIMGFILTVGAIGTFILIIISFSGRIADFLSRYFLHSDIKLTKKEIMGFGRATLRLAYNGKASLRIDRIRIRTYLRIPGRWNQIKLWILTEVAFLVGDLQSISTVYGPISQRNPRIRRAIQLVVGVILVPLMVLFFINPILLVFVLLFGPPVDFRVLLFAEDENVRIQDLDTNIDCRRPFLVEPNVIKNFLITYDVMAKRELGSAMTYFRSGVLVKSVDEAEGNVQLKWRLPISAQLVWEVHEKFQVRMGGKMSWYSIDEDKGKKRFVTINSK